MWKKVSLIFRYPKHCKALGIHLFRDVFRFITLLFLIIFLTGPITYSQLKRFTVLSTSDEHSTLLPVPLADYKPGKLDSALGGYARLSTVVKQIREEKSDEPVLLFSSGDILGGTPFAWLTLQGFSTEISIMKRIGYNAMTIGNHEFDYGPDLLADYLLRAGYPGCNDSLAVISSNLVIPRGHKLNKAGIRENILFELPNGIGLGVFGVLGKEAYNVAGFAEPVTVDDQHDIAKKQVAMLREAGADIILALTHSGIEEDRALAAEVEGIDIILGGHDHFHTTEPEIINNTIIFHSGYYLKNLGKLEFEWNSETGELSIVNEVNNSPYLIMLDSSIDEDPDITEMIDFAIFNINEFLYEHTRGEFNDLNAPLVYSEFEMIRHEPFVETTVGNFVTDAMRLAVEEVTGSRVDFAFQGNGVIRADIIPGSMDWSKGIVSFFDMVSVSGLGSGPDGKAGYPLVSVYLTEKEVLNILEISSLLSQLMGDIYFLQVSGLRYSYDPGKVTWMTIPFLGTPVPAYSSVVSAELYEGSGIQDDNNYKLLDGNGDRLYHVVTDYYLTSFLPMIGDILPRLKLVLKDRDGNPVDPEQTLIVHEGREYKVWEAVARYARSFENNEADMPVIPEYYRNTHERIVQINGIPLKIWSFFLLFVTIALIIILVRLIVRKIRVRRKRQLFP